MKKQTTRKHFGRWLFSGMLLVSTFVQAQQQRVFQGTTFEKVAGSWHIYNADVQTHYYVDSTSIILELNPGKTLS